MEMRLSVEKVQEFKDLTKPLIEFLNKNIHPHSHIIITTDSAEVSEGLIGFTTEEFVPD